MVLILLGKRCTGSRGAFTQYHIGLVMTHLMGKKRCALLYFQLCYPPPPSFLVLPVFFISISCLSVSLLLCVPHNLSHTHFISLILLVFIYIMAGLECCNHCVQGGRDNSYLCSYLGRIQRGKIFPGFVGGCCISCIHFPCTTEMS